MLFYMVMFVCLGCFKKQTMNGFIFLNKYYYISLFQYWISLMLILLKFSVAKQNFYQKNDYLYGSTDCLVKLYSIVK